jgi:nucleoside-diphosphate-sugar epimerase
MAKMILLLGCGYALERVAALLSPNQVICTARSTARVAQLRAQGYVAESVDLADPETLQRCFKAHPEIEVVIDSVPPLSGATPIQGIEAVCAISAMHSLKRLIYLSSSGVFGVTDGSWVDEGSTPRPQNLHTRARLESEGKYSELSCNVVSLRISGIYGPGRGMGIALQEGRYHLVKGERWSNRIQVADLAEVIVRAIRAEDDLPPLLCVSDDRPALSSEVAEFYTQKFPLPKPKEITLEEARELNLSHQLLNQRISNAKMKAVLGIQNLQYPTYCEGAGTEFVE